MDYSKICEVYAALEGTTKGLEKTDKSVRFALSALRFECVSTLSIL